LVVKPDGKEPLRRRRHKWEVNIRMDLREIGWEALDWIYLTHNRNQWWAVVNTVINLLLP
jgi:hypothetical protein